MKKLLALVTGLVAAGSAFASPVLSPAAAAAHTDGLFFCDDCSCWSLRAGFRGDYVFDRHLSSGNLNGFGVNTYSIFANEGVLTFNLWDRLDIYGLVGAASQSLDLVATPDLVTQHSYQANYSTGTIWGVGARATILEFNLGCCGTSYLGADVNYESIGTVSSSSLLVDGKPAAAPSFGGVQYKEWQVSVQLGHKIAMLTPYIAAKWSNAHVNFGNVAGASNSGRHWGYAVGVALLDAGRMSVTAEARFVDESAMTITGEFRF